MVTLKIYDALGCEDLISCETCEIESDMDIQLAHINKIINHENVMVLRYTYEKDLDKFEDLIMNLINQEGLEILPITLLDNKLVKTKDYPSNQEFAKWLSLDVDDLLDLGNKSKKYYECCEDDDCEDDN